jgi:YggT family protein
MNFAGGFALALLQLLLTLLSLYTWVIIIRALISWVSPDPRNPIVQLLARLTEPVLRPLRRLLPHSATGGIDVSPILAILLIQLVRYTLIYSLSPSPRLF